MTFGHFFLLEIVKGKNPLISKRFQQSPVRKVDRISIFSYRVVLCCKEIDRSA